MECGNLRFPTEATHAGSAGADLPGHARRARRRGRGGSLELRQLPQLFVRHGVDQPETEERSGDALRTHRRPGRDDLARERLDPPVLDQRAAELEHRVERASSWQVAQEASLKMGPSPASIASTSSNSSLPAMNRSDSAAVRLVNGSPCVAEADNVGGSGLVTPGVGDSHAVSQRDSKALRVMRLQ